MNYLCTHIAYFSCLKYTPCDSTCFIAVLNAIPYIKEQKMSISVFIFAQIIVFALPSRIILLQIPQGKVIPNYD